MNETKEIGSSPATVPGPAVRSRIEPRVLGRLLIARGDATPEQVESALLEQRRTRERLGEILVRHGVSEERVARALAAQLRLSYLAPPLVPDPAAARLIERELATRLCVVPLELHDRALRVAMADPLDAGALDDLRFRTGRSIDAVVATRGAVVAGIAAAYEAGDLELVLARLEPGGPNDPRPDEVGLLRRASEAPPIVALVDLLLERAAGARASDVHIEPESRGVRVRARVDGVLRELVLLPARVAAGVVSRVKVMARLDIATKRVPQDGRCGVRAGGRDLVLRVSTLPSVAGEKVVLRLLEGGAAPPSLDTLGLSGANRERLDRLLAHDHGAILVTGPTGSGKTTTLYAALNSLDRERRNITTLEDPVEYRLSGVTQVQVQTRGGVSFVAGLRSVLRQDPDVVMIGEMRDRETAEVGMAAAMTGHLMLSTLHTNDAATAVTRLLDIGAARYLVADGLIGVVAQRLVRRVCPHCCSTRRATERELRALGLPATTADVPEPGGCDRCDGTGFSGRVGVFEILDVDVRVRELILSGAGADRIGRAAARGGMRSLAQDAWEKVRSGVTALEEVKPVLSALHGHSPACPRCGAEVRPRYLLCPWCGQRLGRRCPCGARIERAWSCCPRCGSAA
ncbi:MAG: ATPase, T2SS/T4P/T4SS family [Longimicrobiales bacterium]